MYRTPTHTIEFGPGVVLASVNGLEASREQPAVIPSALPGTSS